MAEITEIEKVAVAAANTPWRFSKGLIEAALEAGVLDNPQRKMPYSLSRIDGMLREGKGWVADKLVNYAGENPRE